MFNILNFEEKIEFILELYPEIAVKYIRKDILIDYALEEIKKLFVENGIDNFAITGGTCLSKCHVITNRLSEDIDLVIMGSSINNTKMKIKMISKLLLTHFCDEIKMDDNEQKQWNQARNYAKFTLRINNETILIDLKGICIKNNADKYYDIINLPHSSIYDRLNNITNLYTFPCVDLNTILVNKLIAFHKKYSSTNNENRRLIRHIYDVYYIINYLKQKKLFDVDQISKLYFIQAQIDKLKNDELLIKNNGMFLWNNKYQADLKSLLSNEIYKTEPNLLNKIKNSIADFFHEINELYQKTNAQST